MTKDVIDPRGRTPVKIKKSRGRTVSSRQWLERQLNDPYVHAAKGKGYRSRAAFKLVEMDERYRLLKRGGRVIDLGAAPGGWTQVAVQRMGANARIVAMDILPIEAIPGADIAQLDMLDAATPDILKTMLDGPADIVLSDMAAPTTGHRATDHLRTMALLEAALDLAGDVLAPGGAFVGKAFRGGADKDLLDRLKQSFASVKHVKPPASRAESVELYIVAQGFRAK